MVNGNFGTSDFQQAIFLYVSGVIFVGIDWTDPQRATFRFKTPPDDILAAWQRGEDLGVRTILDARDLMRRKLGDR